MKIERMFSNVEEEKLYSTGNDELDELLERAFCEGYEYAQREFGFPGLGQLRTKIARNTAARTAHKMRRAGQYLQGPGMAERVARVGSQTPYQNTVGGWRGKTNVLNAAKNGGKDIINDANLLVQGVQKTAPKGGSLSSGTFKSLMTDKSGFGSQLLGQRRKEANTMTSMLFGKGKNSKKFDKGIVDQITKGAANLA